MDRERFLVDGIDVFVSLGVDRVVVVVVVVVEPVGAGRGVLCLFT